MRLGIARHILIAALLVAGISFVIYKVPSLGLLSGPWIRENPLVDAVRVSNIDDGHLLLSTGDRVALLGIRKHLGVTDEDYASFLDIATAQGVVEVESSPDGHAAFLVEPKFWNRCGTSNSRWPGSYFRWPLAELAIMAGYAEIDPTDIDAASDRLQSRLDLATKWKVEMELGHPWLLNDNLRAIEYSSTARYGPELDSWFELLED